jgi:hypothetical protein
MNAAATEMLHTLFNELCNNDWKFNGQEPQEVNIDEENLELNVHLAAGRTVKIKVEEITTPDHRVCGNCGEFKSGWPDTWRNIAPSRGVIYACADCTANQEKPNG